MALPTDVPWRERTANVSTAIQEKLSTGVMDGNKITATGDPTAAQDVATKNYVDGLVTVVASGSASIAAADQFTSPPQPIIANAFYWVAGVALISGSITDLNFIVDTDFIFGSPCLGLDFNAIDNMVRVIARADAGNATTIRWALLMTRV